MTDRGTDGYAGGLGIRVGTKLALSGVFVNENPFFLGKSKGIESR